MKLLLIVATVLTAMNVEASTWAKEKPIETFVRNSRAQLEKSGLERHATGDGTVYWTSKASDKPALVLLHGVNDQAGTWAPVVADLAKDYRLIIPDIAGHGESEPKTGPITYALMLERLKSLLDKETEDKVTIAGNSMGGWIGMLYALENPERVERLVLEDASGMAWLPTVPLSPKTREEVAIMMRAVHGPESKTPEHVLDAFLELRNTPMSRISMMDAIGHLVDARLPELKVPVTLIWGRDDGLLPLAYAEALQKKIEGATLQVIEGAAHIPHRQQPRRFVQCLKATC
jgi:abhydrolase domain-containing protein 6